jgi:hypothetical protein
MIDPEASFLLNSLRPFLAVEIRAYHGGSLHFLSRFSEAVISVDSRSRSGGTPFG